MFFSHFKWTYIRGKINGGETRVWGDSAYTDQGDTILAHAPRAQDFTCRGGRRSHPLSERERAVDRRKSQVRARVEHPFLVLKQIFGFTKVRYRGLEKNATRLFVACGLVNLYIARRRLLDSTQGSCS